MNKIKIRNIFKKKRLSLSLDYVNEQSKLIANNFINNLLPKIKHNSKVSCKKLAFYVSTNNEVDPKLLIEYISKKGNIIALPRIIPNSKLLVFKEYKIGDQLENSITYSNLLEPQLFNIDIVPDVVFVPLIAFDHRCNRIGMGGGFYDVTIKEFRTKHKDIIFIGLAYDWQLCTKIPINERDQSLDFIVSPTNIFLRTQ